MGSIEGRVGIEYFSEQAAKSQAGGYKPVSTYGSTKLGFAFKCHRVTVSVSFLIQIVLPAVERKTASYFRCTYVKILMVTLSSNPDAPKESLGSGCMVLLLCPLA